MDAWWRGVPGRYRRRSLLALPLVFIAAITVVDLLSPPDVHLGPLLVVAPAITASFAGARLTGVIGVVAVAAQVVIGVLHGGLGTVNHQSQIAALVAVSAIIVVYRRVQDRRTVEFTRVRSVFQTVQQVLMRPLPRRIGPLRVACRYLPAEDEAHMGGDLYAVARTKDATRLLIGDVRGSGLPAIGDAAVILGAFREAAHQHAGLPEVAAALEESFERHLAEESGAGPDRDERFVTALLLDVPDREPVARLTTCGHPPPVVLRDGAAGTLPSAGAAPPIGMGRLTGDAPPQCSFPLGVGDVLLLYTDGVTEARDRGGAFYPLVERLDHWPHGGAEALLTRLCDDLLGYAGGRLPDDAAMVAVERARPDDPAPDAR